MNSEVHGQIKCLKEENHLLWINQEKLEKEIYTLCQEIDAMNKRQNNMNGIMLKLIQDNNTNIISKNHNQKKRKFPHLF